jgi:hypothetical protein
MSAFICSDATTNALAQLAEVEPESRQRIAEVLRTANTRSVNVRYDQDEAPIPIAYAPSREVKVLSPVQVLKLCACFDYQCSESPEYPQSEAAQIVTAIRCRMIAKLPGYEEADWDL